MTLPLNPDDEKPNPRGPNTSLGRALGRFGCRIAGHRFETFADGFKRCCTRCDREEWVMSRSVTLIGQSQYFWQHLPWRAQKW